MKLRLWPTGRSTEKAREYCKLPPDRHPEPADKIWIPISVIEHVSKNTTSHEVTVEDWWGEKNGF